MLLANVGEIKVSVIFLFSFFDQFNTRKEKFEHRTIAIVAYLHYVSLLLNFSCYEMFSIFIFSAPTKQTFKLTSLLKIICFHVTIFVLSITLKRTQFRKGLERHISQNNFIVYLSDFSKLQKAPRRNVCFVCLS